MASSTLGSKPSRRSGDTRQTGEIAYTDMVPTDELPPSLARRMQRGPELSRTPAPAPNRASVQSRIPQTSSLRRIPVAGPSARPPLSHQTQPWGSTLGSGPAKPISYTGSPGETQHGSPRPRNVLRRKPSNLSQETGSLRNNSRNDSHRTSSSSSLPRSVTSPDSLSGLPFDRGLTESPAEIRVAKKVEVTSAHTVTIYPELDRYRDVRPPPPVPDGAPHIDVPYRLATQDLPPPTPLFSGTSSLVSGFSGSPSTRFSESPSAGPYSRDTTPTSMSSQSPGLIAPMRMPPPRVRQGSRGRAGSIPKDASNETGGISANTNSHTLAAIRESLNSSSSSSNGTVRDGDRKEKKKKKRLSPPPPSPPPRKSSQKFRKGGDEEDSPAKPRREPAQPVMTTALAARATASEQSRAVTSPRGAPPVRPSRDGTPDLQSQLGLPMPIIQSNLSATSLSDRRASTTLGSGALNPSSAAAPSSSSSSSQPDRHHHHAATTSRLSIGREPTPAPRAEGPQQSSSGNLEPGRSARTPSPGVSAFKSRFPLFGRRTKTAPEPTQPDKKDKATRKGPAAGTGHEGYGRLGSHRRRSSSASHLTRGAPGGTLSSQESLNSPQLDDSFFMDRINPVVIAGGEIVENRNTSSELSRTESSRSFAIHRPSIDDRNDSQLSLSSREGRNTLWPSAFPRGTMEAPSLGSRRPSDSSDSEALAVRPTLAFRRSIQRLHTPDQTQVRLPKPIVVRPPQSVTSPSVNSLDTSVMSDDSALDPRPDLLEQARKESSGSTVTKKLTKRARSPRRWNFFGRSQSQPAGPKNKAEPPANVATAVKVVQVKQEQKPMAFYTMMDSSEQEDVDLPDVKAVLREAEVLDLPAPPTLGVHERRPSIGRRNFPMEPPRPGPSAQPTPSQPSQVQRAPAEVPVISEPKLRAPLIRSEPPPPPPPPATTSRMGRPSRLPQVGRIPKVVSARPEQTSPKSFSRPFNRVSLQLQPPRINVLDRDSLAKGPSPPKPSTPDLTQEGSTLTGTTDSNSRFRFSRELSPDIGRATPEFLSFSPRKNSQSTSCTTSSSSGIISFAEATAVVPAPNAPLVEDEIWDEYNDLFGDESTVRVAPSVGSSQGTPFQLEGSAKRLAKAAMDQPLESPTIAHHNASKSMDEVMDVEKPPVPSSVYSSDVAAKINEALQISPQPPLTPFSVSEFVSGYGDRNNSVDLGKQVVPSQRSSSSSQAGGRRTRGSNASAFSQTSEDSSPLAQVNLRVGSMTVSKWLTFGHVLFSPARDDIVPVVGSLKRHSILVIDGLGNDDWSFYAAETYPAATFFNLSPRAPLPADHQSEGSFPLSPPNHHQIQYTSHMGKFPFAPDSFTTVVFRFPAVAPESHYRNIIAEARRVLKPGGYLELSILDLDLNNMGNRSRRAVRRLKERIHARAPDTHLGSTADLILRLLGTIGFSDIKSCRVGVPVASAIARSSSSEPSTTSGSAASSRRAGKAKKDDRSLAEMMSDESPVADENITKMVAKVGRWWYSKCYEGPGVTAGNSMWNDRALLAECEEWRTSLKLLVCYARVPDIRRVASI